MKYNFELMLVNIVLFLLACVGLVLSGSWLVRHLSNIAAYLKVSGFVAAFVIMALSTSLPELFVGISSSLNDNGALALGTVIGSNISNLTIIVGIVVVLSRGIKVPSKTVRAESLHMFFILVLLSVLMYLGNGLSRVDGVILIGVFFYELYRAYKNSKRFKQPFGKRPSKNEFAISSLVFAGSVIVLYGSAEAVVHYGTVLAIDFALPPILVGLFLVALGSSLPELVFQYQAAAKKQGEMSLGDALGSVIANSTLVIGITALIRPIEADFTLFLTSAIFMMAIGFIFTTFIESEDRLRIKEGISLIFLYVIFIIVEFTIKSIEGQSLF